MGFFSSLSSAFSGLSSSLEKQTASTKDKLIPDFEAKVKRLKDFDLEAPVSVKPAPKPAQKHNKAKQ